MRLLRILLMALPGLAVPAQAGWRADAALLRAAKAGDPEAFAQALTAGASPNASDFRACTAVFWVSSAGRADLLKALLERHADVNRECEDGGAPLWSAASNGHLAALTRLLESGARAMVEEPEFHRRVAGIQARGFSRTAALLDSAYAAGKTAYEKTLKRPLYPDFVTHKGFTALMEAAGRGDAERVRTLLAMGASVNATAPGDHNPLTVAVRTGQTGILRILLEAAPYPSTALAASRAASGQQEALELLRPAVRAGDRVVRLAENGETSALLQAMFPGSANWADAGGRTPLVAAAARGRLATVQALVEAGADLTLPANQDAVRVARENEHAEVVRYLQVRVDLAANRVPLEKVLPSVRDFETLWRLRPGWRAIMNAMGAELALWRSRPEPAPVQEAAAHASRVLADLRSQAEHFWKPSQPVSPSYLADMAATLWALHGARNSPEPAAALESAAGDLTVRLQYCRATNTGLGGKVQLRVHTMKGGAEVKNWRVFYLPKIFEDQGAGEPFPTYSSPTEFPLSPGRYLIWAKNPATGAEGERSVVRLGGGRSVEELQIPLP